MLHTDSSSEIVNIHIHISMQYVSVQKPNRYVQKSMRIASGDGIFACRIMFVRPQQQVLRPVLNSYAISSDSIAQWFII